MPAQYKEYYSSPEGKKQLIENIKKEFLILEYAKTQKYETNKDVVEQLNKVKNQVIVAVYLRDNIDKKIKIDDGDAKKYYADHVAEFKTKEQVKAAHILVKTEDAAKAIIARLDKGEDFGQLAVENSLDPSGKTNKGELGWFAKGQMVKPFEAAAFALSKGSYTKTPVQTQYGYHIILAEDKKGEEDLTYDQVKEDVKNFLTQQEQKKLLDTMISKAEKVIKVQDSSEQLLIK
jgi:peptidyl-prolyl cis-trans isomerase C